MYFPGTFRLILAWRGLHERVKEGNVAGAAETFGKLHVRIKGMFAKPPSKEGILSLPARGSVCGRVAKRVMLASFRMASTVHFGRKDFLPSSPKAVSPSSFS